MSIALMSRVMDAPLKSPTDKLVLIVLADYANDDGSNVFPSIATIARRCDLSDRTVQLSIRRMTNKGWVKPAGQIHVKNGAITQYKIYSSNLPRRTGEANSPVNKVRQTGERSSSLPVKDVHPTGEGRSPNPSLNHHEEPSLNRQRERASRAAPAADIPIPAALQNQSAPNHKTPGWLGPAPLDARIAVYFAVTGLTRMNKVQEDDIRARVKPNDPKWEQTIKARCGFGCSIFKVVEAINDYIAGGPADFKANKQTNTTAVKGQAPANGKSFRRAIATNTSEQRVAAEQRAKERRAKRYAELAKTQEATP